ncbi:hypothetical protein FBF48_10335 [Streptococcus salivarius]|uniref:Uncharacterized protein n=1 Tax=Streptococcus salivarius TaxID=1304 RepID=A0AAX2UZE0_STRSL|nr:hypothetical protein [Streptococcus salivarius]TNF65660.1 hypothetical protein FBF48_10335 [Streptococcus salivarius]
MFVTKAKYEGALKRIRFQSSIIEEMAKHAQAMHEENTLLRHRLMRARMTTNVNVVAQQFSPEEIDRLIRLCHPDKHGNSESATVMTQKLLDIRGR